MSSSQHIRFKFKSETFTVVNNKTQQQVQRSTYTSISSTFKFEIAKCNVQIRTRSGSLKSCSQRAALKLNIEQYKVWFRNRKAQRYSSTSKRSKFQYKIVNCNAQLQHRDVKPSISKSHTATFNGQVQSWYFKSRRATLQLKIERFNVQFVLRKVQHAKSNSKTCTFKLKLCNDQIRNRNVQR